MHILCTPLATEFLSLEASATECYIAALMADAARSQFRGSLEPTSCSIKKGVLPTAPVSGSVASAI